MRKRFVLAKEGHILVEEGWLHELCDDSLALEEEQIPYGLIHALVRDVQRLEQIVIETREEVNRLSTDEVVYHIPAQDVCNRAYCFHPAVGKYLELYGEEAENFWKD